MNGTKGAALVLAMLAVALLAALGLSLAVITSVEMRVAANYSYAQEAMSAAETALGLAVQELLGIVEWRGVTDGSTRSGFVDGTPDGARSLSDGSSLDLAELTTNLGDPGWRLFAYGALSRLGGLPSNAYVVVWAGPDPAGREGVVALRADAFGPSGTRRAVQATVSRQGVLSWKDVR